MGEIRVPFEEGWVFPLGTTTLEGRTLPAPANPDEFLAATYGPSWRVPDPAFVFTTPDRTKDRLDDWFRGTRVNRADWDRRYQGRRREDAAALGGPAGEDAARARAGPRRRTGARRRRRLRARSQHPVAGREGPPAIGLDYSVRGFEYLKRWAAEHPELPLEFGHLNLLDTRHVLGWGARLAHRPGPKVLLARHLADALIPAGRDGLWRFADMLGRSGGRAYLEFLVEGEASQAWVDRHLLRPLDPAAWPSSSPVAAPR